MSILFLALCLINQKASGGCFSAIAKALEDFLSGDLPDNVVVSYGGRRINKTALEALAEKQKIKTQKKLRREKVLYQTEEESILHSKSFGKVPEESGEGSDSPQGKLPRAQTNQ